MLKLMTAAMLVGLLHQVDAQEVENNIFEYTKKIHKSLEDLKNLKPENYFSEVDQYRTDLEKFFEQKKRVCEGEFSTVILNESSASNQKRKPVKLKPKERKLCFRELKALQLTFINNMFQARKNYMLHLSQERMKELELAREKAVKSLQRSFDRKSRL